MKKNNDIFKHHEAMYLSPEELDRQFRLRYPSLAEHNDMLLAVVKVNASEAESIIQDD